MKQILDLNQLTFLKEHHIIFPDNPGIGFLLEKLPKKIKSYVLSIDFQRNIVRYRKWLSRYCCQGLQPYQEILITSKTHSELLDSLFVVYKELIENKFI